MMLTAERLHELLSYDPETGEFTWRARRSYFHKPAARAGSARRYIIITIDSKPYRAHRLAWLYCTGAWPVLELDHINGNPHDNRIANLREAAHSSNMANSPRRKHNTSGFKGVWLCRGRWVARITKNYKRIHLGMFATAEEAHVAYAEAARRINGEFARVE